MGSGCPTFPSDSPETGARSGRSCNPCRWQVLLRRWILQTRPFEFLWEEPQELWGHLSGDLAHCHFVESGQEAQAAARERPCVPAEAAPLFSRGQETAQAPKSSRAVSMHVFARRRIRETLVRVL